MDKRKGIILAIVLFLIIGLGTFVFAGSSEDEESGNGTINPQPNGGDNTDSDDPTDSQKEDDGNIEEGGNQDGSQSRPAGGNDGSDGEELVTDGEGEEQNPEETVDYKALLSKLEEMVNSATNKDDLAKAEEFRQDNNITETNIDALGNAEDSKTFDEIMAILTDETAPVVTPDNLNNLFTKDDVKVTITDDTETSYTVTLNGKEVEDADLSNLSAEGTYTLTVVDAAFNETVVTFTIDKTNPLLVINGEVIEETDETLYFTEDIKVTVEEANLESFTSNTHDKTEQVLKGWNVSEGGYTFVITDKAGNKTTYKVVVDKTPIAVNHLYVLNNTHNDYNVSEENRYKVIGNGQDLYVEYVLKEEFTTTPILTIGGKEYEMTCDVASWNDELYKCDAHVTISEDMNLVNGEVIPFTITGVKDIAGNETVVTEKDTTVSDKYGKVVYDSDPAQSIWVYILNADEDHRTIIGNNQKLIVEINVNEELLVNPVITIGKYQVELTRRANDSRYIYSKTITIDADEMNLVHNENIAFTISVTDVAGKTTTLDNKNVTVHEENGYNQVKYDGKAPKYKQLGVLNVDHLRNDEDVTVAKTGDEIRVLFHFDEILDVNPKMTIGEAKTVYELKLVTDYENFAEYTYMADITLTKDMNLSDGALVYTIYGYADAAGNVGKTIKSTDEIKTYTKFPGVRIDNTKPRITVDKLNDNGYTNNGNVNIADASEFDVVVKIDGEVRHEYSNTKRADLSWLGDGEYEIIVTDAAGNSNTIKFNLDTVAAKKHAVYLWANTESVVENIDGKDYVVYYVTNGDVVTATISVNEILGENPKFVIGYNGGSYEVPQDQVIFRELDDVEDFKYVYSAQITIPEDVKTENTELTLTVYNVVDKAGNVTNNGEAIGISNVNRIFVDTTAPEITLYKWFDDGNHQVVEPGVHNYCVLAEATDTNLSKITLNGNEYNNGELICGNGQYELIATDKANNPRKINFSIDTSKPIINVDGTDYTGEESGNNFIELGRYDSTPTITITEANMLYAKVWYDGVLQEDYTKVDYSQQGLYQIEVRDEYSNKSKVEFYVGQYRTFFKITGLDNLVYDGEGIKNEITIEVIDDNGNVIGKPSNYTFYKETYGGEVVSDPTDAGTYVLAVNYYDPNGEYENNWTNQYVFTIEKATPTITFTPSSAFEGEDYAYANGNSITYTRSVKGVNGETLTGKATYINLDTQKTVYGPSTAGKYRMTVTFAGNENYNAVTESKDYEIKSAAMINGTSYSKLAEAISAAQSGDTITLLGDIRNSNNMTLSTDKEITIDLAGHDISFGVNKNFKIKNGHLNIIGEGTLKESSPYYAPIIVSRLSNQDTELEITIGENVTLEGWSGIMIDIGSNDTAKNTTINFSGNINSVLDRGGAAGHGIYVNGTIKDAVNYPVINIMDGSSISSLGDGIYAAGYAEWNIYGGNIEAVDMAVGIKSGILNISGGTLKATGPNNMPTENFGNGINSSGAALQIESNNGYAGEMEINISGGTLISENAATIYEYDSTETATRVIDFNITGGTFISNNYNENLSFSPNFNEAFNQGFITGGTFNRNENDALLQYIADGYTVVEQDGNYVVVAE